MQFRSNEGCVSGMVNDISLRDAGKQKFLFDIESIGGEH
jgi:hypothetical protein